MKSVGFKNMGSRARNSSKVKRNYFYWIPAKKNKIHITPKPNVQLQAVTFQRCVRVTLAIGQCFSLIPCTGILSNNVMDIKYVRFSWKFLYAFVLFIGQIYMTFMCFYKIMNSHTTLNGTSPAIFYGTTLMTMIMFFRMAKRWPSMVQHISRTEELDPNCDKSLTKKCNITCAVVLILALFEHILSLISAFSGALVCLPDKPPYEAFVRHSYPWVFNFIPYSTVLGIITQYLHFQSTFIWNFSDLFVIVMSYYLTSRLEQINKKLLAAQGKYLPEPFWRSSREDYCRVTQLVRRVDNVISGVVFISFANNLFFICLQLFNTLENGIKGTEECNSRGSKPESKILGGYEAAAYFLFSLGYLISRSVAVSLIASQVNSASTVPTCVLYDVPSPVYCVEVQRFIDQVNGDEVALTGLQFFNVTRGLLLTVAGTIVTYELVMFQFNSSDSSNKSNVTSTAATFFSAVAGTIVTYELVMFQFNSSDSSNKYNVTSTAATFFSAVAGTIVTYELVMFQFNSSDSSNKYNVTSTAATFFSAVSAS